MKVAQLLEHRQAQWHELEQLCGKMEHRSKATLGPDIVARFGTLYRAACADLALARAYQLPPQTINFLHQLVARAHNQLYRSRSMKIVDLAKRALFEAPQRMLRDGCMQLAFVLFWGVFLLSAWLGYASTDFSTAVVGPGMLQQMEKMYEKETVRDGLGDDAAMFGFYVQHNTTIGLRCFICGALLAGIGGLFETLQNALTLGTVFGHMATTPQAGNFFRFVTAHGPFELTAIVLGAGAGMKVGFSAVFTRGMRRNDALFKAMRESVPIVTACAVLFVGAAVIEGFISASLLPYFLKATVAVLSTLLLLVYFVVLGWPRGGEDAV